MDIHAYEALAEEAHYGSKPGDTVIVGDPPVSFQIIAVERNIEERRWANINLAVFKNLKTEDIVGLLFDTPATEMQEDQGYFEYSNPEFVEVEPVEKVVWQLRR